MKEIDLTTDEGMKAFQPFLNSQKQLDWRERFEGVRKYINDSYYKPHSNEIPLERLEQIYRNLEKWRNQFAELNESGIEKWIDDTLISINRRIEYLMRNPTDPDEIFIMNMLPKINKILFRNSTMQQWKDLVAGNFTDLKIEINQTAKLKDALSVIDYVLKSLNGYRCLADFEKNNIFLYKGKTLTAKQFSDNSDKTPHHKIEHLF